MTLKNPTRVVPEDQGDIAATSDGHTLEEWRDLVCQGQQVVSRIDGCQWELGDLALQVSRNRRYGQHSLETYAEEIGVDYATLSEYARVAGAYAIPWRQENLSFEHHRRIAAREDRQDWLQAASEQRWSVRELLTSIEAAAEARPAAPPDGSTEADLRQAMATPVTKPPITDADYLERDSQQPETDRELELLTCGSPRCSKQHRADWRWWRLEIPKEESVVLCSLRCLERWASSRIADNRNRRVFGKKGVNEAHNAKG